VQAAGRRPTQPKGAKINAGAPPPASQAQFEPDPVPVCPPEAAGALIGANPASAIARRANEPQYDMTIMPGSQSPDATEQYQPFHVRCGKAAKARFLRSAHRRPAVGAASTSGVTVKNNKPEREGKTGAGAKDRAQERLKGALRENLKRRKSQARQRGESALAPSNPEDLSPHPGCGKKPGE
jgi:hypothetical protein